MSRLVNPMRPHTKKIYGDDIKVPASMPIIKLIACEIIGGNAWGIKSLW